MQATIRPLTLLTMHIKVLLTQTHTHVYSESRINSFLEDVSITDSVYVFLSQPVVPVCL